MVTPSGLRVGLGPGFAFEMIASARRWQGYALRSAFVGMLLAALLVVAARSAVPLGVVPLRDLSALGESFYLGVIGTQLTLVLLVAPAATAGAVCNDRASGALIHVLVTDLSAAEVVLGRLAARLAPVLGLVACSLPMMAMLTLLGGVDPDALVGATLVTIGLALLGSSLAFAFSIASTRAHEALLGTYAAWGLWLLERPFASFANGAYGWSIPPLPRVADPYFLAFSPYWTPGSASIGHHVAFLAGCSAASAALVLASVLRLRAACTRVAVARRAGPRGTMGRIGAAIDPRRLLPGPSIDGNPILWREWRRDARPPRWVRAVVGLYAAVAVVASVGAAVAPPTTFAPAWVNGLQVSVGMLLLSVSAATSLAEERLRGSLDVLMTTTLTTREIVLGKWLGAARMAPALAVLPTLVVLSGDRSKWIYAPTALLTPAFVLVCGAAIAALGLAMATWCAKLGRAVALTVSIYILVAVGWLFLEARVARGPDGEGFLMASPFFFAGELAADLCAPGRTRGHIGWAIAWTLAYAAAGASLLAATLATFDRRLGRVEAVAEPPPGWTLGPGAPPRSAPAPH